MSGDERTEEQRLELAGAVSAERVRVWEDDRHVFHVSVDGQVTDRVRPRRAFPISSRADYVSFLDETDKEACLLACPHRLDKESRKALEHALARTYYAPKILRVDSITEMMGVSTWQVLTDRGYASFEIVDRQHHIRSLPSGRYLLTDADGNRFEIEDLNALDQRSQNLVQSEV
jgi:hypothetical protein